MLSRSVMSDFLQPSGLQPAKLLCPWDFPGKATRASCCFLLQGVLPTQGSSLCLLHWQVDSLSLNHLEKTLYVTYQAIVEKLLNYD